MNKRSACKRVQPQFYNNFYVDRSHVGDVQFIIDNYLGWRNLYPTYQFPDFKGVPPNKLVIGVPASTRAANPVVLRSPSL